VKRFTTRRRSGGARKRAIWVNIPFGGVNYSETVGRQLLLLPEDWEATFTGLANEQAVLRAIVGEVIFSQTVAGTLGGNLFWGIYAAGIDKAVPVFTTTGMSDVRWLRVGARSTASSVTSSITTTTLIGSQPIDVKAKVKLTTNMQLSICAQYGADVASPAGIMSGVLRFLVARD
jgi:hypothetical protein